MVLGWLFGEKKHATLAETSALAARAREATVARDLTQAEALCRELCEADPRSAEGWNLLGVNLVRRDAADPALRAEAVCAWIRAWRLKTADSRAADHLQVELQYPEELVAPLVQRLGENDSDDAADALVQIGARAKPALEAAAQGEGFAAERARRAIRRII